MRLRKQRQPQKRKMKQSKAYSLYPLSAIICSLPHLQITKRFTFAAAHFLTQYHGKCENLHGHNYVLHVTVSGPIRKDGLVIDFVEMKALVKKHILNQLDHTNLNRQFENPSAEIISVWIYEKLQDPFKEAGVTVTEVKLWETENSWVTYAPREPSFRGTK
jgi:6-pyruvoyltetrahydropterin/6-carboxytetrahydropterin synthase